MEIYQHSKPRSGLFHPAPVDMLSFVIASSVMVANSWIGVAQEPPLPAVSNMIRHAADSADATRAFTFDRAAYDGDLRSLPIGVFDSGIGGLTVLEALLNLDAVNNQTLQPGPDGVPDFQDERFVYLGDQANMPYGNYAAAGKEEYLRELILKDAAFLLGKRYWPSSRAESLAFDKPPVKAIVIACNTATAYGLADIRLAVKEWQIPVIVVGVVEAGARGVLELQRDGNDAPGCIAILATVGTCSSMAYPKSIASTLGLAGHRIPMTIQQGFVELAGAIEGDPAFVSQGSVGDYIRQDITQLVERYRLSGGGPPIDTVVLGCTHFPLVAKQILAEFAKLRQTTVRNQQPYHALIAEQIAVIDPAELTARELFRSLAAARLRAPPPTDGSGGAQPDLFYLSVPDSVQFHQHIAADGSLDHAYKYGRETQQLDREDTRVVPLSADMLPGSSLNLIQTSLPNIWKRLQPTDRPAAAPQ